MISVPAFSQYNAESCELSFSYSAYWLDEEEQKQLPAEISFDPITRSVHVNKCNPMKPNHGYTECEMPQYAKSMNIRVVGAVNNRFNSQGHVDITVNIIPDCRDFSVNFRRQIPDLSYRIKESQDGQFAEMIFDPKIALEKESCAVVCKLSD